MTTFNFRSLLLAAIILSNCITWTASRHHYAHNVHQHRTRHRRQGAGLYLPASYVIPGGEGGGPWGEWGEVSPCSRTCGGGVASQKRICLTPGPEGPCWGGDKKYFSCQTQDCPDGSGDFRAEQCAEFNDKLFRGFKYNWVPYTKTPNPCELNCMPHGERFYYRHKLQVTDGTRCNDESFDVCVNGLCQPVGCDMMLNSTAREDKCRECRGNGANCRTSDGIVDSQDFVKGYNDILLIPAGATNIYIEEVAPSMNYLALRAKNGTYYLNGHYHIDFPKTIIIAGAPWTYERSQQGFAAPDKLRCLGPTTEPLYLSFLLQEVNVGIRYEYSVPKDSAPPTDKQYNWVHEEFTPCSATCGGGFQTRNVTCRSREELEIVDASLCDEGLMPPTNQSCSPDPCPAQWVEEPWGECSQRCGSGGVKSREVTCQKIIANGIKSVVLDKECFDLLGPKPEVFQKCNEDAPCPTWFVGHWKPCDQLCDVGKQTRQVVCYQKKNGRIDVLSDGNCTEAKPEEEKPCMLQPCDGVDWVTSVWSGCDSCTSKNRTRLVVCSTKTSRIVLDDSFCSYHNRPIDHEECNKDKLPACEVQWYATQWGKCSVSCGDGVQNRKVFCGMYYDDTTGEGVKVVEDAECANLTKYKDTKPCTVPKEDCPAQWFGGPWTACTETCGGGEQYRRVMCFRGDKEDTNCDSEAVLDSTQLCNTGPCDSDDLLPVSRSSTVVMDDIEEYCDEDYEEVGLDVKSDGMMSDAPAGYAEHESTLETGSGSTLTTAEDLTTEGSGFSTTDSDYSTDYDTGSGETSLTTDVPSSPAKKDKFVTTTTTVNPPTENPVTTNETDSTPTSITNDTEATSSSDSTGSTESISTGDTESTATANTSSTISDTGSTSSNETAETETSGPTIVGETGSTESNVTKEIGSTSESGSTSSGETGSSDTDGTGSTTVAETGSTESSSISTKDEERSTSETDSTSSRETGSTDTTDTRSTATDTGSTSSDISSTSSNETAETETSGITTDSTGSTESISTGDTESTAITDTGSTSSDTSSISSNETAETETSGITTDSTGSTESISTGDMESTATADTGSTSSETGSTSSKETAETETSGPTTVGETGPTESNVTKDIGSTSESSSTSSGETGSSDTDGTGSTTVAETGSTESSSIFTKDEERSTRESSSTSSGETGSTDTTDTRSTATGETESTGTRSTNETVSTSSGETSPTDETGSTGTDKTESTASGSTDGTGSTESTVTDTTESAVTNDTDSTGTEATSTGSPDTKETSSTGTEDLTSTGSTDSTTTTRALPTDSTTTTRAVPTGSTTTTRAVPTEPTDSSTNSSESTAETSTSSGVESSTGSESTSETAESSTTSGSDRTTVSGSTISADLTTGSSESSSLSTESSTVSETESTTAAIESSTTVAESSTPSETESTTAAIESSSSTTESTEAENSTSSETESTTAAIESNTTVAESSTPSKTESTTAAIESSSSTTESTGAENSTTSETESTTAAIESSTTVAESSTPSETESTTVAIESSSSTTESTGAENSTTSETESTTAAIESSSSTTESTGSESSTTSGTESTTAAIESSSSTTESTGAESTTSESTTESGSSTGESSTVSGEITTGTESTEESTTVSGSSTGSEGSPSTGSEESTISTYSTTEGTTIFGSTEESGSTTTELSTTEGSTGTTIWTMSTVVVPTKRPVCKPRSKPKCNETMFGCCPDQKTPASGPFDEGCNKPQTCKNSTYGCCPDGLSPAQGNNNKGCPVEPCADTLFGCCSSDNTTAAQGNDQDGCPPPPPPCASSKYGCCADNDTEAAGPEKEGCPETETSTTGAPTDTTTETTESIKTSEGNTTNEETTDVTGTSTLDISTTTPDIGTTTLDIGTTTLDIGTTTLDPCSGFDFGCCSDNETEASGPDGQGCPCNATEFGCCPDGVLPASGLENEGCPGLCSTSPHGCCQDNKTPAHGPDFEGCCLLQAFGCCPDNRKPAEGPHLEGCGCQYALHGCCPDNVTIAQGADNQGCGCLYTQHGCCPDRHTVATGPDNEGCACNTYQFGCCADGVTTATGPEQQGCHCRESEFGCCGDGETHAIGPDAAGCDCSSSRHGCCPDGRTEATGPKFLGCTDAPKNKQAACGLSKDTGPCHNFSAMWYYDLAYGGCSRFWYGGCDGNGNRFVTKEECEDVCVQPSPKDACKLPSVKGACDGDYRRWHYNSTREQCIPFHYGGCLGNANNFDTRELCQKQCQPSSIVGQCNLPIDQGSCAGNYSRWGFNSEAHRCEQFIWGGCEGNSNRFSSEAACQMRCAGTQPPQCTQPQEAGNCAEKEALWSFSQSENRCLPFYYSGCGGNDNQFRSRETCEQTCPSAYVPDKCTLPAETGQCSNYRQKWFYDTTFKRCRQFYYGGCGGNENKFDTEAECRSSCSEIKTTTTATTTTTTTTVRPVEPQTQPRPVEPAQRPTAPERSEFCFNAIDAGPCNKTETRYAYDSDLGRCVTFQYGGCGGTRNNFPDEAYCLYYCQPMQDICQLPMVQGPCENSLMRWFYDSTTDSCSQFTYGGCEGNDNRFESFEACENRCRTGPAPAAPTTPTTTVIVDVPSQCRVPEAFEDCRYGGEVWYFDQSRHECVSHANQEAGPVCRYTGTFLSQEACERSCGAFLGVDVCKQRKDPGPCQDYVTKVYFDPSTGQCHEFVYGGCLGGANRFSSMDECSTVCKAEIADPCTLPPEGGNCISYIPQWYYDPSRDQCSQFVYTGCSGNENRFETQRDCEARCKRPAPTTTTVATPSQQRAEEECRTPSSLAPCGNNVTVFYYDSERRQCLISGFGGCGHPNTYRTEEECERTCGAFVGMDVCGARLDPGTCRASFSKIYWDATTGSCQPFAYGGCGGGPNRFSNVEECMSICGDAGPAPACLQAVATGRSCQAVPAPRYHYSVAHADCVVFAYLGCGGNDNNFRTYEECTDVCGVSRTIGNDPNGVVPQDCTPYRQECEALADCQYGIDRFTQNGCQRCQCKEDPCVRANCRSNERCVAVASRNAATQEPVYSFRCVAETNDINHCNEYVTNCSRLRCEYDIQRVRLSDGCEKCSCVQLKIDCEPLKQQCDLLKCDYGMERVIGTDGCERCKCKEHPCERKSCGAGERCVVKEYMYGIDRELKYTAECRIIVKAGACPMDETTTNEVNCHRECNDDADCRGEGKCCRRGCNYICLSPVEQTSPHPLVTTTVAPNIPAAPLALPQQEPEVSASEGGKATLRCLFHGNPPPKITWRFGELTIDGNAGRYRLMSDGALEIVSVYRNDTGVYICVADNGLGVATQEVHLAVNDPVSMPAGIAGDENAAVIGELGSPLHVYCLVYGYPQPSVFWYRGYDSVMVPYNDAVYEARANVLLIRKLALETLGQYTCQAYNGEGKATSWGVLVRAYMPEGVLIENEFLVPRHTMVPRTHPPTTAETTTTTTSTTTEAPRLLYTVPVSVHVSGSSPTLNIGADLHLTCDVDGFPEPDVQWIKDGSSIQTDDRVTITGNAIVNRLTVMRLTVADSGLYACRARNAYSSASDTAQIDVQQTRNVVPAKCTDNPFFADCKLIVRNNFCIHKYYSKFCCKSCVEAGQLDPREAELQADQPLRKK